jgi:predicted permease
VGRSHPPRIPHWLLGRLLDRDAAEVVGGDLEEVWRALRAARGPARAALWYWRHALGSILAVRSAPRPRVAAARRSSTTIRLLDDLRSDLGYGLRVLGRAPGYAGAALLVLALGIGANTALFTVVRSVLWQPLPYTQPERLGLLRISFGGIERAASLSAPELEDFRERATLFEGPAAQWTGWSVLGSRIGRGREPESPGQAQRVRATWITSDLFPLLGVSPVLGRNFAPAEERPEALKVAILSHELWTRSFGADPAILGDTIELDGEARTIVGIMPEGFRVMLSPGNTNRPDAGLWIPNTYWIERDVHWLRAVVRLREGASFEQARAEVDTIAAQLNAEHPEYAGNPVAFHLDALHPELVEQARPALLVLGVTVVLTLLMACINVAALTLARAHRRAGEIAMRSILGASRWRLARQVLTEHLVLGLLAGGLGLLVARLAIDALVWRRPAALPRIDEIRLDPGTVALAFGLGLLTLLAVGSAPAWRLTRRAARAGLASAARGGGVARQRGRRFLVAAQMAAALALAVSTALLLRSLQNAYRTDLGFRAAGVTVARLNVPIDVYDTPARRVGFVDQLEQTLDAHSEITAVGAANLAPLEGGMLTSQLETEAGPSGFEVDLRVVTADYLRALGVRLVEGRSIIATDVEQERRVAVVDQELARAAWPGESALGRRLRAGFEADQAWYEVVGVVEHLRYHGVREPGRPQVHIPYQATPAVSLVVASSAPSARVAELIRDALGRVDRRAPVSDIRSLDSYVRADVADLGFALGLMSTFAALALLLAVVGVYGVISTWVQGSIRALGLRMALGALPAHLLWLVLRQGAGPAIVGAIAGLGGAYALARLARSLLFGVGSGDGISYLTATLALLAAALAACLAPALRASRLDPSRALRSE